MEKGKETAMVAPLDNATAAQIQCRFYRLGFCRFGTACRFLHTMSSPEGSSCSNSNSPDSSGVSNGTDGGSGSVVTKEPADTNVIPSVDLARWADAPVFVPQSRLSEASHKQVHVDDDVATENDAYEEPAAPFDGAAGYEMAPLSYATVVTMNNNHNGNEEADVGAYALGDGCLCPYYEVTGVCPLEECVHVHGDLCELCGKYCLNPMDKEQQRRHNADCIKQHERDMEHAFAVQRSRDKACGICLEVVMEKRVREQRFGILPMCKHIFCLGCIRTWRKTDSFENKIKRACPTCRVPSDFVCPSFVWVESGEEKERLIDDYKKACSNNDCMHFKKGAATCPFGNKCFYRHALPSGELVDVGAPTRRRHTNRRRDADDVFTYRLQAIYASLEDFFLEDIDQDSYTMPSDSSESDYDIFDYI